MRTKLNFCLMISIFLLSINLLAQKLPSGNPKDFKVKTCLHSVSYMGVWCGHPQLTVDQFLLKAKELGYQGVMLAAKRPHLSPSRLRQGCTGKAESKN